MNYAAGFYLQGEIMKKGLFVVLIMSATMNCFAGGWSSFTTVSDVYSHENAKVYFKAASMYNPDSCSSGSNMVILPENSAQDKNL